jgi:hypothetical protein
LDGVRRKFAVLESKLHRKGTTLLNAQITIFYNELICIRRLRISIDFGRG